MRPIQWHLKRNWHVPESPEKCMPIMTSLHPHLEWLVQEDNILLGQLLNPLQHILQLFTGTSRKGWSAHLGDYTTRGLWSLPKSKLQINMLELKAVLLALKEFQGRCQSQVVLRATDNTTVVSYINKEGGVRSGSLCALLWRILSWCNHRNITLQARQTVSTQSGDPDIMVPSSGGLQPPLPALTPSRGGSVCHQIQPQTYQVSVPSPRSSSLGRVCSKPILGWPGSVCLSTNSSPGEQDFVP